MRESLNKLHSTIRHGYQDYDLENSSWLSHIRVWGLNTKYHSKKIFFLKAILTSTNRLVSLVYNDKRSVLVHCSDGWDRTAQVNKKKESKSSLMCTFLLINS
jgi:hypothetical protein